MKKALLITISILLLIGCKKQNNTTIEEGEVMKFEVHSDSPIFSLTVRKKFEKIVLLPTKKPVLFKTYYNKTGDQMFQYNESIKVIPGDRIEFSVPSNDKRKILKVGAVVSAYSTQYFLGSMQPDNGNHVVIFFVPEKSE